MAAEREEVEAGSARPRANAGDAEVDEKKKAVWNLDEKKGENYTRKLMISLRTSTRACSLIVKHRVACNLTWRGRGGPVVTREAEDDRARDRGGEHNRTLCNAPSLLRRGAPCCSAVVMFVVFLAVRTTRRRRRCGRSGGGPSSRPAELRAHLD